MYLSKKVVEELLATRQSMAKEAYIDLLEEALLRAFGYDSLEVDHEKTESLEIRERQYREMLEMLPQAVFEINKEGYFTFLNENGLEMFGFSKQSLKQGLHISSIFLQEQAKTLLQNFTPKLARGRALNGEHLFRRNEHDFFTGMIYSDIILTYDKPICIRGIVIDITERKKAENALSIRLRYEHKLSLCSQVLLKNSKTAIRQSLQHLLEASQVCRTYMFKNVQLPDGRLAMKKFEDVRVSSLTENPETTFHLHPYDEGFSRWQEELSNNRAIQGKISTFPEEEYQHLQKSNLLSLLVIPLFVSSRWYGFIGFDITTEEREFQEVDISLLQTAADMIGLHLTRHEYERLLKKRLSFIQFINQISFDLINIAPEQMDRSINKALNFVAQYGDVDRAYTFLYAKEDQKMLLSYEWSGKGISPTSEQIKEIQTDDYPLFVEKLEAGQIINNDFSVFEKKNESEVLLQIFKTLNITSFIVFPMFVDQNFIGFTIFDVLSKQREWTDETIKAFHITNQLIANALLKKRTAHKLDQLLEDLAEKNKSLQELNATKDKFFSIIAHDLKNPFNNLMGFSSLLLANPEKQDKVKQYAQILHDTAQKGFDLLENLLEWSRSQTGRLKINPVEINIQQIMYETVDLLGSAIQKKALNISVSANSMLFVRADIDMLRTIWRNLVSNAIKFTGRGGKIKLSAVLKESYVECEVADTGIGMNEATQQKLFRIDVHHTTLGTEQEEGTGLGLLLCREFAEKNGGKIWVKSQKGLGSRFKFTMPLVEKELATHGSQSFIKSMIDFKGLVNNYSEELIEVVNEELIPYYELTRMKQSSAKVKEFAAKLIAVGEKFKLLPLKYYGENLLKQMNSFNIKAVQEELDVFPTLANIITDRF